MSCGVGHRRGSDPALLQLWCRPAATAPIRSLTWELPYAADAALKRQTNTQTNKKTILVTNLEVAKKKPQLKCQKNNMEDNGVNQGKTFYGPSIARDKGRDAD